MNTPAESMTKPFLVLRVGDFDVALHPGAVVMVVPEDYKATITIGPKSESADSSEQ